MTPTVVDTGVLIGFLKSTDAHHVDAVSGISALAEARDDIFLSSVSYAELMVGAIKSGSEFAAVAQEIVEGIPRLTIVPVGRRIAFAAAHVRARRSRLGMLDAIVVGTAQAVGAERIITTDHDFDEVDEAIRLSDFVAR